MLSLIDHMLDEAAITYIELGRFPDAIDTVSQAIAMCDELENVKDTEKPDLTLPCSLVESMQ